MERYRECPNCGSSDFKRVGSQTAHFVYDRICRDCETRFTPPTPMWMAVVGTSAVGAIICIAVIALVFLAVGALKGHVDWGQCLSLLLPAIYLVQIYVVDAAKRSFGQRPALVISTAFHAVLTGGFVVWGFLIEGERAYWPWGAAVLFGVLTVRAVSKAIRNQTR